jgi:2-polyprenyl-3-methyl-5-hydroxy-6-metoxy-1,4-benzoquinol methylase
LTEPFNARDYWESRLNQHYSLTGVGYRRLGLRFNEWMYRLRARVFARVAGSLGVAWSEARVLDVGAGTGFYVDQWHRLGVRSVTGFDITAKAVEELSRHFPQDRFRQVDIGQALEPGIEAIGPFDAVSAMDVLFHIVDDDQYARAFENIAALLRPGGWFLWSDNFLRHETERVEHQVSRSLAESERLVSRTGFEIVERVPMFVLMNYPADTRSRTAKLAWTAMVAPAALAEPLGWLAGAVLYPIDLWLTGHTRESPTTEIMICRKRPSGGPR